jgi:DNA-binding MarR family transcriptional regulator
MQSIEEAIQQLKFQSNMHKAQVNVLYTASVIDAATTQMLKPYGISPQQYNILRILKGSHPKTASIKYLTERMLDRMSNASRLVDKLKAKGLVERIECPNDRRQVEISITEKGMDLLVKASAEMQKSMSGEISLTEEEAGILSDLLDRFRG